ncbi:MAG TPA: dTDP-4-dehydrorhamnose 3,5-epimerase [Anaerolineae bacterium]|nr:dTDP-4-dehydrorhamnose 3,5-epimerase [Anaerolineae bacterium]
MKFVTTSIPNVILIEPKIYGDNRGYFWEVFSSKCFEQDGGIQFPFIQDNQSGSRKGILRGLHYQIKHPQGKLIRAIVGEVFDVAVDLRKSSPTFGKWVGYVLSAENKNQLWVPPGFAHGFYVISEWADVLYKVTDIYAPQWERTLLWNDPEIGIEWPIAADSSPVLSEKDQNGKLFSECEVFD